MAVAARPGPSDARVPCPLCGGLVHPIAGKCKHCKAELTGYQAARPAASTPLPSLHKSAAPAPAPTPSAGNGHGPQTNGHAAHAPIAAAIATAQEIQPVLPPRPTTRSHTAEPVASAWRSWPVLVIVLAMIAIVVAVVLMVWPAAAARAGDSGKRLQPPPAPERMPTTVPDIKPTVPDRRNQGAAPHAAVPDPWAPGAVTPAPADPSAKPDADDLDDDDLSLKDPFADPRLGRGLKLNRPGTLFATMVVHLCRKMVECGLDDPMVTSQCDRFSRVIPAPLPSCPAATRCYQHIDAMACGKQPTSLAHVGTLLRQFTDCSDAIRC
ncbi:MAG TPA: hypothetical protein VGD80_36870 [Kofleriaceae bacterium]